MKQGVGGLEMNRMLQAGKAGLMQTKGNHMLICARIHASSRARSLFTRDVEALL